MRTAPTTRGPVKAVIGGKTCAFRSHWEFKWARRLEWMKLHGAIREWEYEPDEFEFAEVRHGTTRYTPDFKVTECDGSVHYEEIKGYKRPRGETQIRRMRRFHADVDLRVIRAEEYREAMRAFGRLPGQVEYEIVPPKQREGRGSHGLSAELVRALADQGVTPTQFLESRGPRRRR